MSPETWARVSMRVDAARWIVYFGVVGLVAGAAYGALLPPAVYGGIITLMIWVIGPILHYFNTLYRMRREKGLPWEQQNVALDEQSFSSTYESGFTARVPWTKFKTAHRVPEGLLLRMEGRGQAFIPASSLDDETEAFILRSVAKT